MGTPDFAVASLDALVKSKQDVVGVVTAPDRKAGRGQKIHSSAVKRYAESQGLNILQPTNLKSKEFIQALRALNADLQIIVAFRMLPEVVWNMPPLGTFNLHGSLLPLYRGAAPINWAIINQEKETGVTTFFLKHKIDTGDIILQERIKIEDDDDVGIIHDRLMEIGAKLVVKTVDLIQSGQHSSIPQNIEGIDQKRLVAPKIYKEDCLINWNSDLKSIHAFIRGLSPYPAAWTKLKHKSSERVVSLKIFKSKIISTESKELKIAEQDKSLWLSGAFGTLELEEIQIEGKRRMTAKDLLNGFNINDYEVV